MQARSSSSGAGSSADTMKRLVPIGALPSLEFAYVDSMGSHAVGLRPRVVVGNPVSNDVAEESFSGALGPQFGARRVWL